MLTDINRTATDQRLIEQSLAGNRDAFGQLVLRHQDRLITRLSQLAELRVDAEDVVQEAFVQAYLKLATFRRHCRFYTWLYRIALNVLYTRNRYQRVRACLSRTRPVHEEDQYDPYGTPADELERREDATQIGLALDALSEEHQAILALRGGDGCDYETIAETLELTAGTVRSRLHRARRKLREQLQRRQICHG
ncbi:MAG: sigma-70 family RNA polymerase sigma factor [Planctomycetota bacterium]|nr:sigma-70 family RNA polymerase sigma factor [Planctomycetota bacterium]